MYVEDIIALKIITILMSGYWDSFKDFSNIVSKFMKSS